MPLNPLLPLLFSQAKRPKSDESNLEAVTAGIDPTVPGSSVGPVAPPYKTFPGFPTPTPGPGPSLPPTRDGKQVPLAPGITNPTPIGARTGAIHGPGESPGTPPGRVLPGLQKPTTSGTLSPWAEASELYEANAPILRDNIRQAWNGRGMFFSGASADDESKQINLLKANYDATAAEQQRALDQERQREDFQRREDADNRSSQTWQTAGTAAATIATVALLRF